MQLFRFGLPEFVSAAWTVVSSSPYLKVEVFAACVLLLEKTSWLHFFITNIPFTNYMGKSCWLYTLIFSIWLALWLRNPDWRKGSKIRVMWKGVGEGERQGKRNDLDHFYLVPVLICELWPIRLCVLWVLLSVEINQVLLCCSVLACVLFCVFRSFVLDLCCVVSIFWSCLRMSHCILATHLSFVSVV